MVGHDPKLMPTSKMTVSVIPLQQLSSGIRHESLLLSPRVRWRIHSRPPRQGIQRPSRGVLPRQIAYSQSCHVRNRLARLVDQNNRCERSVDPHRSVPTDVPLLFRKRATGSRSCWLTPHGQISNAVCTLCSFTVAWHAE